MDNFTEREKHIAILFAEWAIKEKEINYGNGYRHSVNHRNEYNSLEGFFDMFEKEREQKRKALEIKGS